MAQDISIFTMGRKAVRAMKKNKVLSRLLPVINRTGIPQAAFYAELRKSFRDEYAEHRQEFAKAEELLSDELSRKTFRAMIEYRKTFRKEFLKDILVYPQYFQKDIFGPAENEVFVDCGAYTGDTIEGYIENFGGGVPWKKVYAWEPDETRLGELRQTASKYKNVEIVPSGVWKEKAVLKFKSNGDMSSKFSEFGEIELPVDTIDNVCGGDRVTFIKMDIEGSEKEALLGAETVIKRDKPRLAICIYHKADDFYKIPLMLKEMVPEYKFFVRQHSDEWTDTVLYATL